MTRFVLVTRHPDDCRELQELVRPAGITIRPYPVLRVEEVDDATGWRQTLELIPKTSARDAAWLLLASPRAPHRLVHRARQRGADHLLDLPAAAVGAGTAAAGAEAGLRVEVVGPGTGDGLAAILIERLEPGSTMIFACGRHRRPELPHALRTAGHHLQPLELYHMTPTPPRELPPLPPSLDAVVLTSPRSARLYLDSVGGLPLPCRHLAMGPTTRTAAAAVGIECMSPREPTIQALAEELCTI